MLIPDEPYLGFAALCHIAGAFCLIPALLHTRTPQGTIAWLISLLAFPYIAVPFYLILGRRTFSGYVETRRRQTDSESPWGELTDKITNCMKPYAIRSADTAGEIM
ncbi:MAG: PLDc N-terminal domain-containing protein [Akkermansia sp.]